MSSSWTSTVVSSSGVDAASCVQYTAAPPASADLIDANSAAAAAAFLSPQDTDAAFQVGFSFAFWGSLNNSFILFGVLEIPPIL